MIAPCILLLLHGFPQTKAIWHQVAPALANNFTVIASDLRGYGESSKPHGKNDHSTYSKRSMAADQHAVMQSLGHQTFSLLGLPKAVKKGSFLTKDARANGISFLISAGNIFFTNAESV